MLDRDSEGRYFVVHVDADGYPGGLPQKARAIVERNPARRRAVVRVQIWLVIQNYAQIGREFIARLSGNSDLICVN